MKNFYCFLIALVLGLTLIVANPLYNLYRSFQDKQIDADRVNVVSSLLNYNQKNGIYPTSQIKKKDRAIVLVEKKVKEGKIKDKNIVSKLVEVEIPSLKSTLNLTKKDRYFMVKDNPYSAFSWRHAKRDNFSISSNRKIFKFTNVSIIGKQIKIDDKTIMTKVNTAYNYNSNTVLVGGKGSMIFAKIVGTKVVNIPIDMDEVCLITDDYIQGKDKSGNIVIKSIKEVIG